MSMSLLIPLLIMVAAFLLRMPIAVGMLIASIYYFLYTGRDLGMVVELMGGNLYTMYVALAVPLFVFTANIMNTGTVTDRVFNFANTLVGRYRGGMGHVNVLASLIFSGMTGSAIADASGLGKMEIRAMKKQGYDAPFASAITAASSTIGPIFPPSIPMIMYAMLSGASLGALFLAGIIPGLIIAVALMLYIMYIAKKRNYPFGVRYAFRDFIFFTIKAIPALLTPVILLGGIYTGVMTPTEAAGVAALYTIIISIVAYRSLGPKTFWHVAVNTGKTTGTLGLLLGSAFCLSYIVAAEGVASMVANSLMGITENPIILLLILNLVFLLLGMFLDTSVLLLVFTPIVLPLVNAMGIDLVHFGVVLVVNMMIGLSTPPFGMLLFIVAGVSGTKLFDVIKEVLPMVAIMIVVLFLITYFPQLVLFLPNLAG
ncbi:TRAP transporter large permease [Halalkalibacter sp. AB-rgal2]|uniref:TRAP transporter large permease n=1 Tax=Halalkalibacter sp. AB-rgal2 TaxID=3242695 RepID=UPI00359ECC55